ncbi:MAG: hypothetical protein E6K73_10225, partial [Candidatus Eisenbacteria bacterium]
MPFVSLVPATKPSAGPVMGPVALAMTFFTLLCAAALVAILWLNQGTFTYTLDDPYLHLSLAENIAAGHYGINRDDVAAPSSSVLWPYLLAPFSRLPFGYLVPLFLNYAASLGTIALLGRMISTSLEGSNEKPVKLGVVFLVVFLILAANLVGLAFTGMEHSLQVLLSVALVAGLIEETTTARVPSWLPAAIVAGPLVRYENLALSLPALALLACRGRAILAAGCLAALLLGLGGFSLYLHGMGLGWVPLSVSAKSGVIAGGGSLASVLRNLRLNLRPGLGLLFCLAAFVAVARRPRTPADRALALWAAAAVVLHMLVGRFGWFFRYEIYVWISSLVMLIFLFRDALTGSPRPWRCCSSWPAAATWAPWRSPRSAPTTSTSSSTRCTGSRPTSMPLRWESTISAWSRTGTPTTSWTSRVWPRPRRAMRGGARAGRAGW